MSLTEVQVKFLIDLIQRNGYCSNTPRGPMCCFIINIKGPGEDCPLKFYCKRVLKTIKKDTISLQDSYKFMKDRAEFARGLLRTVDEEVIFGVLL